jgi:ABC-type dipeptide/oligopeptide/nickel transport system ATPase component
MCDRIAVMYKGRIVEEGRKLDIINNPQHRYTQSLLSAVPTARPGFKKRRVVFEGGAV